MNRKLKDLIRETKEYEREVMKAKAMLEEIDELDNEITEIVQAIRGKLSEMEDSEESRELNEKFERYIKLCEQNNLIRGDD